MPPLPARLNRAATLRRGTTTDRGRPSAAARLYGRKWRSARRRFLADNPTCKHCHRDGRTIAATVVDHIIPHRGRLPQFWNPNNWQALCKPCHDRKTASGA